MTNRQFVIVMFFFMGAMMIGGGLLPWILVGPPGALGLSWIGAVGLTGSMIGTGLFFWYNAIWKIDDIAMTEEGEDEDGKQG